MTKQTIKYLDLCSGIGGFRYGIEAFEKKQKCYNFKCILSADIKQDAIDTYNLNFNEKNGKKNINDIEPNNIGSFDLLTAGFPCQPFSSAGKKKGFKDDRGGMIFKIIDICKTCKPEYVLLENVSNLLTIDNGKCIDKIVKLFESINYHISYKKLNSSLFGCPQSRERVYIMCSKSYNLSNIFDNIKYNKKSCYIKDIIDSTDKKSTLPENFTKVLLTTHKKKSIYGCKINDKRGGAKNIHSWDIGYNGSITEDESRLMSKIMLERRKKHWAIKKNIEWMDGMPLTFNDIKTFEKNHNLKTMLDKLVRMNYLKIEKCKDLINGKREYKEDSDEGYNICKGKLSFPITKILNPNDVAPTLTATDSNRLAIIVDNSIIRNLNKTELKKICGFPESMLIPSHVNMYDLFGNMATPPVITELIRLLLHHKKKA
tara:strand:+ start:1445 stop:2731 length:1287 start_codon:yes stop_codon:yes gene_type:complete